MSNQALELTGANSGSALADAMPAAVNNLDEVELDVLRGLLAKWNQKKRRNLIRTAYYDGTRAVRSLGISIPPRLSNLRAVLGWPEKTVRALAMRNIFEGFVTTGAEQDPFELSDVLEANRFDLELPQTITSTYKHSCAFVSTTLGDTEAGEPEVLISPRSAEYATADWDRARRAVSSALAITDLDTDRQPSAMILYLPYAVLEIWRGPGRKWRADRHDNPLGVPLVEPFTFDPQLDRPFGRSRISRAVMDITDRVARTLIRTEVHAEFFSTPQRYLEGADEDAFAVDRWEAVMGRFLAIGKDEDGDVPHFGQFPQVSMQPHNDMLRMLAAQFSGETGLPLSSLGIVTDNPASAEAIFAAKEDLIIEAQASNRGFGASLQRVAQRVVMLRDGRTEPSTELRSLRARWRNPAFPSPVSAADALVKLQTVFPWIGESEVSLEMVGFNEAEITRLLADKRRAAGGSLLDAITAATRPPAIEAAPDAGGLIDAEDAGQV